MPTCRICHGPTPRRKQTCATCAILCPRCKKELRDETGHVWCRPCRTLYQAEWRSKHGRRERRTRVWTLRDSAVQSICRAVKRGALMRQPCADCGLTEGLCVHFPDWENKPDDYVWLCRTHKRLAVQREKKGKP